MLELGVGFEERLGGVAAVLVPRVATATFGGLAELAVLVAELGAPLEEVFGLDGDLEKGSAHRRMPFVHDGRGVRVMHAAALR